MTYRLTVVNKSTNAMSACVYQRAPDVSDPNIMAMAWLAKKLYPTTECTFAWDVNYQFVWMETTARFQARQMWEADLNASNMVTLHCDGEGAYTFQDQTASTGPSGNLAIKQDASIPPNEASVGIGMANSPTFLVQAQPNMSLIFTAKPDYWITAGEYVQGQVLNITEITDSAQIDFPPNVYAMTAVLDAANKWTVSPTLV